MIEMAGDDPWKKRKSVRITAAIDMLFPVAITGIYLYRLMYERPVNGRNGFFTPKEKQGVAVFLWCGAFTLNIIQFVLTYYLFIAVKFGTRDAETAMRNSKFWLIFSNFLFVLLLSEFIFYIFFDKGHYGSRKTVSSLLCAAELFFKPVGMYFVKEFIDGLKSIYSSPNTKVQFMSFISSVRKSQPNPTSNV